MKQKLKIAIYSGTIPSTTFIENLIEGLADNGIKVLLFGKQTKQISYKQDRLIAIYGLPKSKTFRVVKTLFRSLELAVRYPGRFVKLYKQVRGFDSLYSKWNWWSRYVPITLHLPDVFHIQWAKDLEYWMFLKDQFAVKIVLSFLGSHINYSPIADLELAKRYAINFPKVDAFHGVSKAILKEAEQYNADLSKGKLIYTQIKPSIFEYYDPIQKQEHETFNILSIGRYHWVKGYSYAIDAMRKLKKNGIKFTYTIIANGKVPEELLFKVHDFDLKDEIRFLPALPQAELFEKMKSYDALVLPSLSEGIANVVLEAMAIGLPVVSADCGGMAEVVIPDQTGWLVPMRDAEAITAAVIDIHNTTELELQTITENAHNFVKQHFNYSESIAAFVTLYEDLVG